MANCGGGRAMRPASLGSRSGVPVIVGLSAQAPGHPRAARAEAMWGARVPGLIWLPRLPAGAASARADPGRPATAMAPTRQRSSATASAWRSWSGCPRGRLRGSGRSAGMSARWCISRRPARRRNPNRRSGGGCLGRGAFCACGPRTHAPGPDPVILSVRRWKGLRGPGERCCGSPVTAERVASSQRRTIASSFLRPRAMILGPAGRYPLEA